MAGAFAPLCRHGTCLPVLPLDAWTSGTSPRSRPVSGPRPMGWSEGVASVRWVEYGVAELVG